MALRTGDTGEATHADATCTSDDYEVIFRANSGESLPPVGFGESDIVVDFGTKHDRVPHASDGDGIDLAWQRQLVDASRTWDASKFRLAKIQLATTRDGKQAPVLSLGLTTYREHVGTCTTSRPIGDRNALRDDGVANHGIQNAHLASALGVQCVLETRDGGVVLLRRSNGVVGSVGKWNGPSGHPEPSKVFFRDEKKNENDTATNVRARAELFASILREVVEETGVPFSSLSPPKLIGAMLDYFGKPDLLFRVKTNLTSREVLEKCETARDAWESDSAEIVEAPGRREKNYTNEVHLAHNQELSRKFWRRCPVSMAATTRAMAECLSSL
jgi:8-oxo-dGTP pyrophosphatase MutT (NUDIX family)